MQLQHAAFCLLRLQTSLASDKRWTTSLQTDVVFVTSIYFFPLKFAIFYIYLLVLQFISWLTNNLALCFLGDFWNEDTGATLHCSALCTKANRMILHTVHEPVWKLLTCRRKTYWRKHLPETQNSKVGALALKSPGEILHHNVLLSSLS